MNGACLSLPLQFAHLTRQPYFPFELSLSTITLTNYFPPLPYTVKIGLGHETGSVSMVDSVHKSMVSHCVTRDHSTAHIQYSPLVVSSFSSSFE